MKKEISFSMIKKISVTDKTENILKKLNKIVFIGHVDLCKFSVIALFESIGCNVLKVNSCLQKSEQKVVRGKKILTKKYKKFRVNFADNVDINNIVKDINEKKINFLY